MASIPERFLPVESVVRQLLKERFPKLSTHPGSAIHDVFVLPASVIYQRFRDTARVIQRNQSVSNYNTMLPEELDRLAGNFLLSRRAGTPASGIQRVYFNDVQAVSIETSAVFTDTAGRSYRPVTAVRLTATQVAANYDSATDEYYVDVAVLSQGVGSDYKAGPGQITVVTGVTGAARTLNLAEFSGGDDQESNSELYGRILSSVTNRELVKKDGIRATIQDAFPSVKSVLVQGFGDPLLTRDMVSVATSLDTLIPASYCQKVNLPLDENGEVVWVNNSGAEILNPISGFVGAIYDLTGRDFNQLTVSPDGTTTIRVSVQEGFTVRFLGSDDPDTAGNDYTVTRIESVPVTPNGIPVKVLRLDRPLIDTALVDVIVDKTPYTILGSIFTDKFHIGGKVDVYIDSTSAVERQVVINAVPSTFLGSDVGEIPLVSTAVDDLGNTLFEDGVGFVSPVIAITKVEQLDFINDTVVRELIPDTQYAVVRSSVRGKFTQTPDDLLVVRGSEALIDPETGIALDETSPLFTGQRLRVTYLTNPDINTIQMFVDSSSQRDVTKDLLVKSAKITPVSLSLQYTGTLSVDMARTIITDYVAQLGFDTALTSSDLVTILTHFGATKVQLPIKMSATRELGNGRIAVVESEDALTPELGELFRVVGIDNIVLL